VIKILGPYGRVLGVALLAHIMLNGGNVAQAQAVAAPPPQVTVVEVHSSRVPIEYEYAARIEASREVEVRAQASGILLRRNFNEGAAVKAGDLLFEIDPGPYEADLAVQRARLNQAKARLSQATRDASRTLRLFDRGTVSEKARDDALSEKELAAAEVVAAEAQVRLAELNLGYTKVTAPISGITGQEQVPEGSLIGTTADTSLLTRITQVDPAYVNFSVSDSERSEVRALLEAQGLWERAGEIVSVHIEFGDGQRYPEVGKIDFASAGLDPETGTLRLRAVVANPESRLLPGQFVRVIVTGISLPDAIVVPHEAVMQGPQGQFVYTVDSQGNAEIRPVVLGREVEDGWIVQSGLRDEDRLVSEGVIKVRPGAPVATGAATDGAAATDAGQ
jgi:membrane fusion protein (multidrug efflux system)